MQEGEDLQQRQDRRADDLGKQQKAARQRGHQHDAHDARFAVIDHRQRRLHALEQDDDADQARQDIFLIGRVGSIGLDDGNAQKVVQARGEDQEPQRGTNEGGDQPFGLAQELCDLAPGDGIKPQPEMVDGLVAQCAPVRQCQGYRAYWSGAGSLRAAASAITALCVASTMGMRICPSQARKLICTPLEPSILSRWPADIGVDFCRSRRSGPWHRR